jgi:hypothetical protein
MELMDAVDSFIPIPPRDTKNLSLCLLRTCSQLPAGALLQQEELKPVWF